MRVDCLFCDEKGSRLLGGFRRLDFRGLDFFEDRAKRWVGFQKKLSAELVRFFSSRRTSFLGLGLLDGLACGDQLRVPP